MDANFIGVILVYISGLWSFHNVFGETDSMVSMFHDVRNELNNLKLSTERSHREVMRLETQVNACHRKYDLLYGQITAFEHFEKRLSGMEHEIKARNQGLLKRIESVEMSNVITIKHDKSKSIEGSKGNEKRADVPDVADNLKARVDKVKDNLGGNMHVVDDDQMVDAVEDEQNSDFDLNGDGSRHALSNTKGRVNEIDKRIVPVTSAPKINTRIAFSAYIFNHAIALRYMQTLPFNTVKTNEGQAFNTVSNIFTCPVSGIYYFASSLMAMHHQHANAEIVKNGLTLVAMYSEPDTDINHGGYDQGSNCIVTLCNKGESVWVRVADPTGMIVSGDAYTTFTGFLISKL